MKEGDPLYCYANMAEGSYTVKKFEGKELCFVDSVKLCGNDTGTSTKNRVSISFRIPRNASVGDKFASRAGQKGELIVQIGTPRLILAGSSCLNPA
jgi:DNA-directed RNA polymerase I subunit RPA2